MVKGLTLKEFITRANAVHNKKYDYSKSLYVNMRTEVCIICPIHGSFFQKPNNHVNQKQGCPDCSIAHRKTSDEFIEDAREVHGDLFNYSLVHYVNCYTNVCIVCSSHGKFWQLPATHLAGRGCKKCASEKTQVQQRKSLDKFINDARRVHGELYDYSQVIYINACTKISIICPSHGEFYQTPSHHVNDKTKCPKCIANGYSKISIQFLDELADELFVKIQHAENIGEYEIYDEVFKCKYKCDGYFQINNKKYVVEFHGDYWHGNPKVYNPESICKFRSLTFDELYKKTMDRMKRIKAMGYEVIYIWERDYKNYLEDRKENIYANLIYYYNEL